MNAVSTYPEVTNYIAGEYTSNGQPRIDVISPTDGRKLGSVPMSSAKDLDSAVKAAEAAFKTWSQVPIKERVQVFFRYKTLMEQNLRELAQLVHDENGKTLDEAIAEVEKSIELTEFACSLPQLVGGELLEVSKGVECRIEKKPLGVVASIAPFNFPHMVPHWTIPNAIALGNCMILKPSEIVPISAMKIAAMLKEAGLPDGVFNVVNGGREIVEAICDHPGIQAVSFVGSTKVAQIVYRRSTQALKRCVALGGAKNHLLVFPDAHVDMTASNVLASMSGCAGQRCMAAAAMVGVGPIDHIVARMVEEIKKIVPGQNLGAVISPAAKARIEGFITEAEQQGAKVLVDGRNTVVSGKEGGNYVGPTIVDYVTPDMRIAQEEVFGPVISIIRTKSMDEAIAIENANPYGNAAAVFTQSGSIAREVMERASAGMIGVNIGVPVPREPFSFGGWNDSRFGSSDITGKSSIDFWTQLKKTTVKWNPEARTNWMS
ncbi:MAG: CoA-acylating methylmalonate-semialdehyde dehydrogenase [Bacteroidia bacterium]